MALDSQGPPGQEHEAVPSTGQAGDLALDLQEPLGRRAGRGNGTAARTGARPLSVRRAPGKGRGVFANRAFAAGERVEWLPVLVIPQEQLRHLDRTVLRDYYFAWGPSGRDGALALGFGSLYNHSYQPNARFEICGDEAVALVALRAIDRDEEITVNYHGEPADEAPVWFRVKG